MQSRVGEPGAVKNECWVLADGPEQPGNHLSGTVIRGTPDTPKHGWKTSLKQTIKAGKNSSKLKLRLPRNAISSRPSPASGKNSSPEWIHASPEDPLRQQTHPRLTRG
jgi:hypothetical protein